MVLANEDFHRIRDQPDFGCAGRVVEHTDACNNTQRSGSRRNPHRTK
jgi:hypothetical protein